MRRRLRRCAKLPASPGARPLAGEARSSRVVHKLQSKLEAGRISFKVPAYLFYVLGADNPFRVDAQAALRTSKHQRRTRIALELPVQPGHRDAAEFSAIRLPVGAAVPHASFVSTKRSDFRQVIEIGLRIVERYILRIPTDVSHGNVNRFQ